MKKKLKELFDQQLWYVLYDWPYRRPIPVGLSEEN